VTLPSSGSVSPSRQRACPRVEIYLAEQRERAAKVAAIGARP
jgi:hypothetical protein